MVSITLLHAEVYNSTSAHLILGEWVEGSLRGEGGGGGRQCEQAGLMMSGALTLCLLYSV